MIAQAAPATHTSQAGGLFLLAWGLMASAGGLAVVTNFRGFADNFARQADASSAGLRKLPPWKWQQPRDQAGQTRLLRFIGILFVIVGPIGIVAGIISISQGRIASHGLSALPVPFRYLVIAFGAATVGRSLLSRHGLFRPAVRRGGWRLALALLSSLGGLILFISIAMGQMTIGIVASVICVLSSLVLMEDKPAGPGSGNVRD